MLHKDKNVHYQVIAIILKVTYKPPSEDIKKKKTYCMFLTNKVTIKARYMHLVQYMLYLFWGVFITDYGALAL